MSERKRIYLCLAHMSEDEMEQKYIKEAFDTNWEARPVWKPMHKQPCYKGVPAYVNGVSENLFKVGMCLPAGPYVTDEDVRYIVETIKNAIDNNN